MFGNIGSAVGRHVDICAPKVNICTHPLNKMQPRSAEGGHAGLRDHLRRTWSSHSSFAHEHFDTDREKTDTDSQVQYGVGVKEKKVPLS